MARQTYSDNRTPLFTIIGGTMYDTSADLKTAKSYWRSRYGGENYAYFRIYDHDIDTRRYVSAVYTKMPVCIFQFDGEAVGLNYKTVVEEQIPSLSVWTDQSGCHFDYTDEVTHVMKTKSRPLLGDWEETTSYKPSIQNLPSFTVKRAASWWQIVREVVEEELADWSERLSSTKIQDTLAMVDAFHHRIYDSINRVHMDTICADRPERYGDAIISLTSFEACRVLSLYNYSENNRDRCRQIAERLIFDETVSAQLSEIGDCRVWHNALDTRKNDDRLYGCTIFGTGYSGYPGGMATLLRKLLEYAYLSKSSQLLPHLKQGLNWLLMVQNEDGSFPYTVPSVPEVSARLQLTSTGPKAKAFGGAAEAIRALIWGYKAFEDQTYLDAAEKAITAINPTAPHYAFRGFGDFRDGGEFETDATSGLQLANANLELFQITNNPIYKDTALILGYYVLTWHHWWRSEKIDPHGFVDPMAESFCPHISPYNTAVASELYSKLYSATQDAFWQKLAEFSFVKASDGMNPRTGGISEVYNFDKIDRITTMGGESGMVSWSVIDAGCALLRNRTTQFIEPATDDDSDGSIYNQCEITAQVGFLKPKTSLPKARQLLRPLKPFIKPTVKLLIGVEGVRKINMRQRIRKSPSPPLTVASEKLSYETYRGVQDQRVNMTFGCHHPGHRVVTMSALRYNPCIKQVLMPIIKFGSKIDSAEPLHKVGETITACEIRLSDGSTVRMDFLPGTGGLGVSSVRVEDDRLICDATIKAGWQFGGELTQIVRLSQVEG